jgi:Spy/CpxP family protein refolding chaperone
MMVAAERAAWQNPRVLGTLFLVFVAGAACGALWMRLGLHEELHRAVAAASHDTDRDAVLQKFKTELDLSSAQSEQIAMVLDDYRQYYQSLEDQLNDLRDTGKSRIMEILNPDQRQKFQKMMNDLAPQLENSTK